jgi:hypothetical protein
MRIIITATVHNTEYTVMLMEYSFTCKADGHWEMDWRREFLVK